MAQPARDQDSFSATVEKIRHPREPLLPVKAPFRTNASRAAEDRTALCVPEWICQAAKAASGRRRSCFPLLLALAR